MILTLQDFKLLFYPSTINYQLLDETSWFLAIIWCLEDCVYPSLIMLSLWCGYFLYFLYISALFRRTVPIGICPAASPSSAADYRQVPAIMGCTDGSKYIPLTQKQHRIWYTGFARAVSAAYPEPVAAYYYKIKKNKSFMDKIYILPACTCLCEQRGLPYLQETILLNTVNRLLHIFSLF